jgi:hypothetical protein
MASENPEPFVALCDVMCEDKMIVVNNATVGMIVNIEGVQCQVTECYEDRGDVQRWFAEPCTVSSPPLPPLGAPASNVVPAHVLWRWWA